MTPLHANSHPWRAEREGFDLLMALAAIEDHRQVIKVQAFHEGSWDAVFDEACAMGPLLRQIQRGHDDVAAEFHRPPPASLRLVRYAQRANQTTLLQFGERLQRVG